MDEKEKELMFRRIMTALKKTERAKERGRVYYYFPGGAEIIKGDRELFRRFCDDFENFFYMVLPVYIERHKRNTETDKDPRASSEDYFFIGDRIYAEGKINSNETVFYSFDNLGEIVHAVKNKISDPSIDSVIVSTLENAIRINLFVGFSQQNIIYDGQIAYLPTLDCDIQFDIQMPFPDIDE